MKEGTRNDEWRRQLYTASVHTMETHSSFGKKKKKNTHAKGSVQEQDLKYVMRLNVTESKNFTKRHLGASK